MSKGDEREFLFSFFLLFAWMNLEKNFTQSSTTKVDQQLSTLLSFFFSYFIGRSFLFLFLLYTSVRPVTAPFVVCWPLSFFNWIAHDIPSPCRRRHYRKKKESSSSSSCFYLIWFIFWKIFDWNFRPNGINNHRAHTELLKRKKEKHIFGNVSFIISVCRLCVPELFRLSNSSGKTFSIFSHVIWASSLDVTLQTTMIQGDAENDVETIRLIITTTLAIFFFLGHPFLRLLFYRRLIYPFFKRRHFHPWHGRERVRRIMGRDGLGERWCPRRLSIHLSNEGVSSALSQSSKMVDVRFTLGIDWPLSSLDKIKTLRRKLSMCNFFVFQPIEKKNKKKQKISRNWWVKITRCDGCQAIVTLDERLDLSISCTPEKERMVHQVFSSAYLSNSLPINRQLHCSLQILK